MNIISYFQAAERIAPILAQRSYYRDDHGTALNLLVCEEISTALRYGGLTVLDPEDKDISMRVKVVDGQLNLSLSAIKGDLGVSETREFLTRLSGFGDLASLLKNACANVRVEG